MNPQVCESPVQQDSTGDLLASNLVMGKAMDFKKKLIKLAGDVKT